MLIAPRLSGVWNRHSLQCFNLIHRQNAIQIEHHEHTGFRVAYPLNILAVQTGKDEIRCRQNGFGFNFQNARYGIHQKCHVAIADMGNQHPAPIRGIGWIQLAQTRFQINGRYQDPPDINAAHDEWRCVLKRLQGRIAQNLTNGEDVDAEQLAAGTETDELNNVLFFKYECQN